MASAGAEERVATPMDVEGDDVCWICLDDCQDAQPLVSPCKCPRKVHPKCMARWQLQQAGRPEETHCRFCNNTLADWKTSLTPEKLRPEVPKVQPIMVVYFEGEIHRIPVKQGNDGLKEFTNRIRELFRLPEDVDISLTFGCKEPMSGQHLKLEGMGAFDAAVHCASVAAAERQQKVGETPRPSAGGAGGSEEAADADRASGSSAEADDVDADDDADEIDEPPLLMPHSSAPVPYPSSGGGAFSQRTDDNSRRLPPMSPQQLESFGSAPVLMPYNSVPATPPRRVTRASFNNIPSIGGSISASGAAAQGAADPAAAQQQQMALPSMCPPVRAHAPVTHAEPLAPGTPPAAAGRYMQYSPMQTAQLEPTAYADQGLAFDNNACPWGYAAAAGAAAADADLQFAQQYQQQHGTRRMRRSFSQHEDASAYASGGGAPSSACASQGPIASQPTQELPLDSSSAAYSFDAPCPETYTPHQSDYAPHQYHHRYHHGSSTSSSSNGSITGRLKYSLRAFSRKVARSLHFSSASGAARAAAAGAPTSSAATAAPATAAAASSRPSNSTVMTD